MTLHDLLLGEPLEIGPAQLARERKRRGKDGAAVVRISFDDFALPCGVEQIGESRRGILGLDQIGVVANWAERGECRRVHAIRADLFERQVLSRVLRQERRQQGLAPPTDKIVGVRAAHNVHFMDADLSSLPMRWNTRSAPDRFRRTLIPGYLASNALLRFSATGI